MFNPEFDPLEVLQEHEDTLNKLIIAHNEVANLTEELSQQLINLNTRIDKLERFIARNISEIK